jgi:pimeloyl-ACP methyl ester carboxylesterase
MGFAGTMDDWAPSFVDQLGASFRVVVLDNAGVGQTAAVSAPLTVTEMANQVSATIHGAQLVLYPGAGHAFWFQDEGQLVPRVEPFLR